MVLARRNLIGRREAPAAFRGLAGSVSVEGDFVEVIGGGNGPAGLVLKEAGETGDGLGLTMDGKYVPRGVF